MERGHRTKTAGESFGKRSEQPGTSQPGAGRDYAVGERNLFLFFKEKS